MSLARLLGTGSAAAPALLPGENQWIESVRAGDFREAARRIDALPPERARTPELRYVRARAAVAVRDFARARALLDGLEHDLPILGDAIARARAEGALETGPFDEAARVFGARSDAESLVKAGTAWERAGALDKARTALDRALRALGSDDGADALRLRVRALSTRARVARAAHDAATASTDLRFLAVEAPATEAGFHAEAELGKLSPPARLTSEQRLTRARKLAEAGRLDDALAAIDALAADPRDKASPRAIAHARGWAYYLSRADYSKAAELLRAASELGGEDAVRDALYSARALSRAQDDAHAIERYEALVRRNPTTPFAEEARYQIARLHMLLGEWDTAVKAYKAYLDAHGKHKKARFVSAARYELGLTWLASAHPAEAVPLFASLARAEDDPLERASLRELEGAALGDAGDKEGAAERLTAVIRDRPLSFPALMSAARLAALGLSPPAPLGAAAVSSPVAVLGVELPPRVALLARLGFILDAEHELQSHESEIVARYAPRGSEALCEAYGAIGAGAERYRVGRAAVKAEVLDRAPTDATRWAWDCVYPAPFPDIVRTAESTRALPIGLLYSVMRQESAFRVDAISPANAVGLLQLMPDTAGRVSKEIGADSDAARLALPGPNVELGAYYLRKVFDTFGGSVTLAVAAYNAGPRAVSRWLEVGENLPLDVWVARIPFAETRGYVARVVGNLARYEYLRNGAASLESISLDLPKGVRAKETDY